MRFIIRKWSIFHMSQRTIKPTISCKKNSDQPVHPPSMAVVLLYPSLDSLETVEGTCDQQRPWSDCTDAQTDLSLGWSHKSYCSFCHALAHMPVKQWHFCHVSSLTLNTYQFEVPFFKFTGHLSPSIAQFSHIKHLLKLLLVWREMPTLYLSWLGTKECRLISKM